MTRTITEYAPLIYGRLQRAAAHAQARGQALSTGFQIGVFFALVATAVGLAGAITGVLFALLTCQP